jgi:hypothetical protein
MASEASDSARTKHIRNRIFDCYEHQEGGGAGEGGPSLKIIDKVCSIAIESVVISGVRSLMNIHDQVISSWEYLFQ